MAQAKTRTSTKRSQGSRKPQARARGSSDKPKSQTSRRSASSSPTRSKSSANGKAHAEAARHAVESKAKDAGHAVGNAASKARVPLVATGAALAGAAGGFAFGVHQARQHRGLGTAVPRRPLMKVTSRDLAKVAKEVGSFGAQMGQVASELQHARAEASSDKHRSPVEVVLEGLTARRSRA